MVLIYRLGREAVRWNAVEMMAGQEHPRDRKYPFPFLSTGMPDRGPDDPDRRVECFRGSPGGKDEAVARAEDYVALQAAIAEQEAEIVRKEEEPGARMQRPWSSLKSSPGWWRRGQSWKSCRRMCPSCHPCSGRWKR